jgi:hypothetical protein
MSLRSEVHEKIRTYLGGKVTLDEFRDWLAPRGWNVHKREDEDTVKLVNRIEGILSEFDHGDWSEEEVQQELTQASAALCVKTSAAPTPYVRTSTTWTTASVVSPSNRSFGIVQLFKSPKLLSSSDIEQPA